MIRALIAGGRNVTRLVELPWRRIPDEVYAPTAKESARHIAERLHPLFPNATTMTQMFSACGGGWTTAYGGRCSAPGAGGSFAAS